jgi:hypothetical protein
VNNNPGLMLSIGKIVAVHRDRRNVDVFLLGGGLLKQVPVLSTTAGSHEGSPYLPDIIVKTGEPSATPTGTDTYCVVGSLSGDIRTPVVLGLLFPNDFETSFEDLDVNKRMGGSYTAFDPDGFEINRPDGTYIRVGTTTSRAVDSATNRGKVPFSRTTGTAVGTPHVYIKLSNGLSMDFTPAGQIIVTRINGTTIDLTGDPVPAGSSTHLLGLT